MTSHLDAAAAAVQLRSDSAITGWVRDLIGTANQRQLWFIFLDEDDHVLPAIVPLEGIPALPPRGASDGLADMMSALTSPYPGTSLKVVFVLERLGDAVLNDSDDAWIADVAAACADLNVPLRAALLSSSSDVRLLDIPDVGPGEVSSQAASS